MTDSSRSAKGMKGSAKKAPARPRPAPNNADGEEAVLAAVAAMTDDCRPIGERLHAIIRAAAPDLVPRLWYGMPAYAKEGKVLCFFRGVDKLKERYMTLGFNDPANLDDGNIWPTSFAIMALTPADEQKIAALVKQAAS